MMRYQVFDSRGNRVDKEFNIYYEDPLPTLPFGTYTVKSRRSRPKLLLGISNNGNGGIEQRASRRCGQICLSLY